MGNEKIVQVAMCGMVNLPMDLVEELRDNMWELCGEREWWRDEPRKRYRDEYAEIRALAERMDSICKRETGSEQL